MYSHSLKNKVIIVTGGSGGIGTAIVKELSHRGASVVSVYNKNHPDDLLDENIIFLKADLTNSEDWDRLLYYTHYKFSKVDVLINCAGLLEPGCFLSLQEDQFKKMVDLNFTSVLNGIHKTLAVMRAQKSGHIINIGSLGGIVPMPHSAVYSATKFALRGFSFSLAEELKGIGISVSLITPGSVATKMLDHEAQDDHTAIAFLTKSVNPDIVADAVLKTIRKPKIELVIPRNQSIPSKLLIFSPKFFSIIYKILHSIGVWAKRKYMNQQFIFTLEKGEVR